MAQSYDRLGLTELRDDADRVLKKNFPNSRYQRRRLGAQAQDAVVAVLVSARRGARVSAAGAAASSRQPGERLGLGRRRGVIGGSAARRRRP